MSNGDQALDTLRRETVDTIAQIQNTPGAKSCAAHEPIGRAMVLLLRWQVAGIDAAQAEKRWRTRLALWAVTAGVLAGLLSGNAAAMLRLVKVLFA